MARMLNSWGDVMVGHLASFIVADVHERLLPEDQAYFRTSREAHFGKSLEDVVADRDARVDAFRKYLDPLRLTLRKQPFIGGASPNYGDYIVFGQFQWARVVSSFQLLKEDDAVYAWRERLLDTFDSMARKSPSYAA
jgi:glutathione S-transferase